MKNEIIDRLAEICGEMGILATSIKVDFPEDIKNGDYSTSVAMANAKRLGMPPFELASKIAENFERNLPKSIAKAVAVAPGFINFWIKDSVVASLVEEDLVPTHARSASKVMIEYTDPNTFKVFHIGHLMSNAIGESLSRLIENSGSEVVRICYPSDIGLHIAKSIWAIGKHRSEIPNEQASIIEKTSFLGKMYVEGTETYEKSLEAKEEIDSLNRKIYERSDADVNGLYELGRKWSLSHFDLLYSILGSKFDLTIYESEMAPVGLALVKENLEKGIFKMSDGAVVFEGEKYGLHTRVFVNSHGLPTYEAKDVGLNVTKFKKHPDAKQSIIVTASEQNDYFRVLTKALTLIDEKDGMKTKHIGHGMMRFASGKMSSRTGKVITAEALLAEIRELVEEKIKDRKFTAEESEEIANEIAVGAIKYSILRSSIGSDIIFDSASSISFEGDSGPYLQYAAVRADSILKKAKEEGVACGGSIKPETATLIERELVKFDEIAKRARDEFAPQIVANYLINLAGSFNSYYAKQIIIDKNDPLSPHRIAITKRFRDTMERGLWLLGIKVPAKM